MARTQWINRSPSAILNITCTKNRSVCVCVCVCTVCSVWRNMVTWCWQPIMHFIQVQFTCCGLSNVSRYEISTQDNNRVAAFNVFNSALCWRHVPSRKPIAHHETTASSVFTFLGWVHTCKVTVYRNTVRGWIQNFPYWCRQLHSSCVSAKHR